MKTFLSLFGLFIIGGFLPGCKDDQISKTKDFTPEVLNYEFFIEGIIDGKLLRYPQINDASTNVSNKYFINHKETWLQAYVDSLGKINGYWKIRIHDIDIRNIELPYKLKESEGNVTWYDERIDPIIENNSFCQGIDSGCTFVLKSGENNITLTSNENNILEGEFSGKAAILGIGMSPYYDEALFHEIANGKFRIRYSEE